MEKEEIVKKFKGFLSEWPLSVILLPLFFVFHGVKENFGFILAKDFIPLLLFYCLLSTVFFFLFYWIYRNRVKAALMTFLLFSIFFFYGAIQDFFKIYIPSLNRYRVLIPSFFMMAV